MLTIPLDSLLTSHLHTQVDTTYFSETDTIKMLDLFLHCCLVDITMDTPFRRYVPLFKNGRFAYFSV
jgi:hypothetical protein